MINKIAIKGILKDLKWSRNLFQFWKKISYDRDATIGKIIIDWARDSVCGFALIKRWK